MGIWRRDRRALNLESEPGTGILGRWNPVFFFYFGFAPEVWLQRTPSHPAGTFRIFNGKCSIVALRPGDPGLPAPGPATGQVAVCAAAALRFCPRPAVGLVGHLGPWTPELSFRRNCQPGLLS